MKRTTDSDALATFAGIVVGAIVVSGFWLTGTIIVQLAGGLSAQPLTLAVLLHQPTTRLLLVVGAISGGMLGGIVGSAVSRRGKR